MNELYLTIILWDNILRYNFVALRSVVAAYQKLVATNRTRLIELLKHVTICDLMYQKVEILFIARWGPKGC